MYAQALEIGPGTSEDLSQTICRELLPALRTERGFSGALSLVDRATENTLLLIFWETEEEAARPLPPYFAALLAKLGLPDAATYTPRVWEVDARA
jgi:hypothetical protein